MGLIPDLAVTHRPFPSRKRLEHLPMSTNPTGTPERTPPIAFQTRMGELLGEAATLMPHRFRLESEEDEHDVHSGPRGYIVILPEGDAHITFGAYAWEQGCIMAACLEECAVRDSSVVLDVRRGTGRSGRAIIYAPHFTSATGDTAAEALLAALINTHRRGAP